MTETELLQVLARGEDSRHQFKRDETNADSVAAELAAFANSGGGELILGVVVQPPTSATVTPEVTPEVDRLTGKTRLL